MSISSSLSSYIIPSLLTAKGDIVVHNGTTLQRVSAGQNGYTVTSDSSQPTGISWSAAPSGGSNYQVPIAYSTITANTATVSITGIPNTYQTLGIIAMVRDTTSTKRDLWIRFNSSTTGFGYLARSESGVNQNSQNFPSDHIKAEFGASDTASGMRGYFHMTINQYANTSYYKYGLFVGGGGQSTTRTLIYYGSASWTNLDAISSVQFLVDTDGQNRIEAGSKFYIYGLK